LAFEAAAREKLVLVRNEALASGYTGVRLLTGRGQGKKPYQVRVRTRDGWKEQGTFRTAAEAALCRARYVPQHGDHACHL